MMNGRHLPSGQSMHGQQQHDMNRGRQHRPYSQHQYGQHQMPQMPQQFQPNHGMYAAHGGYMNPYAANAQYYPQHQLPQAQYQQYPAAMYSSYQHYGRSPPTHYQPYTNPPPVVSSSHTTRAQHIQSPVIVTSPYSQPPAQTPPSANSVEMDSSSRTNSMSTSVPNSMSVPTQSTSATPVPLPAALEAEVSVRAATPTPPSPPPAPKPTAAFIPPLPWYSDSAESWPSRPLPRRRRRKVIESEEQAVELPSKQLSTSRAQGEESQAVEPIQATEERRPGAEQEQEHEHEQEQEQEQETKSTTSTVQAASENAPSTTPTTPVSIQRVPATALDTPVKAAQSAKPAQKVAPVPVLPALPKPSPRPQAIATTPTPKAAGPAPVAERLVEPATAPAAESAVEEQVVELTQAPAPSAAGPPPSWAQLFKGKQSAATSSNDGVASESNGAAAGTFARSNQESLAGALQAFNASARDGNLAFLKPRGLVNTGNMCYMNSVLQVLVFCVPFYEFLDQVGKRAAHSFKSDTPLIDAMIMFMREFPTITSADSVEKLNRQLRSDDVERFGEAFIPEFVYDVINRLPRFSSMRRGHQQDAEEFLGFLLEGLHDECVQVMKLSGSAAPSSLTTPVSGSPTGERASPAAETGAGWHEVGPKQRAATTQSSGISVDSPLTKIFGGMLRSELKVQGSKLSVTMEPYQPLQLDIDSPTTNNVVDALKAMTRPETIVGDFGSTRPGTNAVKQLLIETLPPVLIIHLKRFKYNNVGGTQKIWKKIGYPLELELPKEVFSRQRQTSMLHAGGLPKYRLLSVIYHHGKNATGGHYTVDVRRQDGSEWVRMDDTVVRRVTSEDVAEGGSEEDPKVIAKAMADHKKDTVSSGNIFDQIKDEDDAEDSGADEWKQVNGVGKDQKKWSSIANGAATPVKKNKDRDLNLKDNKVAYLLFYQRVQG